MHASSHQVDPDETGDLAASEAIHHVTPRDAIERSTRAIGTRPRWWAEISFLGVLYLLYSLIRNAAPDRVAKAEQNAFAILHLERTLGLDIEHRLNDFAASTHALVLVANYYYATLHFVVTLSVLVWLYVARPHHYRTARSVLMGMTLLALLGYWFFPLAPPRLTPGESFIDTVRVFGTWGVSASEPVATASNQYAAMPSMHFGWALWSGVALACLARRPIMRAIGALYPIATLLVVLFTANHFLLDVVGALGAFGTAVAFVYVSQRGLSRRFGVKPVDLGENVLARTDTVGAGMSGRAERNGPGTPRSD